MRMSDSEQPRTALLMRPAQKQPANIAIPRKMKTSPKLCHKLFIIVRRIMVRIMRAKVGHQIDNS